MLDALEPRARVSSARALQGELLGEVFDLPIDQPVSLSDVYDTIDRFVRRDRLLRGADPFAHLLHAIDQPAGGACGDVRLGLALILQIGFGDGF